MTASPPPETQVCITKDMLFRMTAPAMALSALAVFFDVIDTVLFVAAPDVVVCKSGLNLLSSMTKWLAFGVITGIVEHKFFVFSIFSLFFFLSGVVRDASNSIPTAHAVLVFFLPSQSP